MIYLFPADWDTLKKISKIASTKDLEELTYEVIVSVVKENIRHYQNRIGVAERTKFMETLQDLNKFKIQFMLNGASKY